LGIAQAHSGDLVYNGELELQKTPKTQCLYLFEVFKYLKYVWKNMNEINKG
jgi:hypothetical protein